MVLRLLLNHVFVFTHRKSTLLTLFTFEDDVHSYLAPCTGQHTQVHPIAHKFIKPVWRNQRYYLWIMLDFLVMLFVWLLLFLTTAIKYSQLNILTAFILLIFLP